MNIKSEKDYLIDNVKEAIRICHTAPDIEDQGYPYAAGYARSCLQSVLEYLVKSEENKDS